MQPEGSSKTFYILMKPEDPDDMGWEAKELTSECVFCWAKDIPFRTILFLLSQSSDGVSESGPSPKNESGSESTLENPSESGSETGNV